MNRAPAIIFLLVILVVVVTPILTYLAWTPAKSISNSGKNLSAREFRFSYELTVSSIPSNSGQIIIWMPVPESNDYQKISDLKISSPYPYTTYQESEYGNRILKIEAKGKVPETLLVSLEFKVRREAYSAFRRPARANQETADENLRRFLAPDLLVPITGPIKEEADKVVKQYMTSLQKARAVYEYVSSKLTYDKKGTGWGRGDAVYACQALAGNCTDFHSLFIGMARASGIPARFVMGFPVQEEKTSGEITGYHCWAEFYLEGKGWIPVDASEGNKHPELREFYFGQLDANRVEFTLGRDIQIDPQRRIEHLNYFIYPFVLVDGKVHQEIETKFRFADLNPQNNP